MLSYCANGAIPIQFSSFVPVIFIISSDKIAFSGNAHIAAMLGVKVITLWGATHPFAGFQPFNQPDDFCLTSDRKQYPFLPTSVYGNKKVAGYENAMRTILPSKVIEKINSNLT